MDVEKTITEIEWLERTYALPDERRLELEDLNRAHDRSNANNPWFKLWQDFGVVTRPERTPRLSLPE